jgi:hypothetical protein
MMTRASYQLGYHRFALEIMMARATAGLVVYRFALKGAVPFWPLFCPSFNYYRIGDS